MPTPTEKRIVQKRRAKKTGAILVPILEDVLEEAGNTGPVTQDDFRFMRMLIVARALPRSKGVYSPSMLGSCVRQAYFSKRGEEKILARSPQTNGYFLNGNFVHLKWQFLMWRAHVEGRLRLVPVPIAHEVSILRAMYDAGELRLAEYDERVDALNFNGDGTRPAVEVRVAAKNNPDMMGTVDTMCQVKPYIKNRVHVIDFKGINLVDFMRTIKKGAKRTYRVQLVGYGWNVNLSDLPYEIEDCLLVSENKAGPTNSASQSPIALHETRVRIEEHLPEVKRRLRTLRWYDSRNEVPPPECVSTLHMSFQECPFNRHCLEEVRAIQRERQDRAAKRPRNWRVARTSRREG